MPNMFSKPRIKLVAPDGRESRIYFHRRRKDRPNWDPDKIYWKERDRTSIDRETILLLLTKGCILKSSDSEEAAKLLNLSIKNSDDHVYLNNLVKIKYRQVDLHICESEYQMVGALCNFYSVNNIPMSKFRLMSKIVHFMKKHSPSLGEVLRQSEALTKKEKIRDRRLCVIFWDHDWDIVTYLNKFYAAQDNLVLEFPQHIISYGIRCLDLNRPSLEELELCGPQGIDFSIYRKAAKQEKDNQDEKPYVIYPMDPTNLQNERSK